MTDDQESLAAKVVRSGSAALAGGAATGDLKTTAVAVLIAAGSELAAAGVEELRRDTPTHRLLAALAKDRERELREHEDEIAQKLDVLVESVGDKPGFLSNVAGRARAWQDARDTQCADPKKQRILMAALLNSLDVDAYNEGMTLSLFAMLRDLDYGEIRVLNAATHPSNLLSLFPNSAQGDTGLIRPASKLHLHLAKLLDHRLVYIPPNRDNTFVFNSVVVTEVGEEMIKLIGSDAFRDAEAI